MAEAAHKAIIAFDVDGTLTESKQTIQGDMSALLCKLLLKKRVALISGASLARFQAQLLDFLQCVVGGGDEIENLTLLPTNGSRCYQFDRISHKWKVVDEILLASEIKEKVITAFERIIADPTFEIPPSPHGDYIEDRGTQLTFSALGQDAPLDTKGVWDPDHSKRQKIKAALEKELGNFIELTIAGTTSIDIDTKGFTKASGLERLLERLGLKKEDMLFIGDSIFPGGNDYSPEVAGIEVVKTSGPEQTAEIIETLLD